MIKALFSYIIPIAILVAIGVLLFLFFRQRRFQENCCIYLMERQPEIFVMLPKKDTKQKLLIAERFVTEDYWEDYLVYMGKSVPDEEEEEEYEYEEDAFEDIYSYSDDYEKNGKAE